VYLETKRKHQNVKVWKKAILIIKNKIKISYVTWSQNVYILLHLHRGRDSSRTEQHGTAGSDLFWSAQR